jgi:signal transduction histidine kinase
VRVSDGWLAVTVADDGIGVGELRRTGGLGNMRHRAEELGGTFTVEPAQPRSARLALRVPV